MYLDEMGIWLYQQYTIHVSDSTISRVLKREKISWKVLRRLAAERNATLRADWLARLTAWEPEWIMFVDESAANERSADRKRGWAPIGISAEHFVPVKKSMRWSILPCYTLDGYIAWEIHHGSYTTETFNRFIQERVSLNWIYLLFTQIFNVLIK